MPVIRIVEISGFRGIKSLKWTPNPGINALIGPGDSCKSTILDAIDWCLGTRRTVPVSYADFHKMDTSSPIRIVMTIGELPDELLAIRKFGECLKGFQTGSTDLESEPSNGFEDVIQVTLKIERDLEPQWFIVKEDGNDDEVVRFSWDARQHVAPVRIGASAAHHLTWRRGSALSKITEDNISAHDVISAALQSARAAFSGSPPSELDAALEFATKCCNDFAVANVHAIKAGLDIDAVSAGDNSIALHDHEGVPLRRMGVGSVRLLSSALLAGVSRNPMMLIDELEYGLEPHRIIRLLHAVGSKETATKRQVFLTTHSPVAIAELAVSQIWLVRESSGVTSLVQPLPELQGTLRAYPNALLARKVFVCEGASEVGIMRGLDRFLNCPGNSKTLPGGLLLHGIALVDGKGSSAPLNALAFTKLGFKVALLRDSDVVKKKPRDKKKWDASAAAEKEFTDNDGKVFCWDEGFHTEAAIFRYATDENVRAMLAYIRELWDEEKVSQDVANHGNGAKIEDMERTWHESGIPNRDRNIIGLAANKASWFKRTDHFEKLAYDILLPSIRTNTVGEGYLYKFFVQITKWCGESAK